MTVRESALPEVWRKAAEADILNVARSLQPKLRKAGADWNGPCPAGCGKANGDGFIITPAKGVFLCRPSSESGDVIDMVAHARGCSKTEAVEFITGEAMPEKRQRRKSNGRDDEPPPWTEEDGGPPRDARSADDEERRRRLDKDAVQAVLDVAAPITATHAEAYLAARGLHPGRLLTGDLKFVAALDYWGFPDADSQRKEVLAALPALIAIIRSVAGAIVGVSQTFLDPIEPRKWFAPWERDVAPKKRRNPARKFRKSAPTLRGGMIRLGPIGERLAVGEGFETTLSWGALAIVDDVSLAAAFDLDNLAGGMLGAFEHPTLKAPNGHALKYPTGEPDPDEPGMILPDGVQELILLGDGDSDPRMTRMKLLGSARRFARAGRTVRVHFAPPGLDWNDALMARAKGAAA
jgi:hypothetical protein